MTGVAEKNAIVVRLATALCPPDLPKSLHLAVHEHRLNTPMGMRHSKAIWSLIAVWPRMAFRGNSLAERSDIASRAFLRNSIEPTPIRPGIGQALCVLSDNDAADKHAFRARISPQTGQGFAVAQ